MEKLSKSQLWSFVNDYYQAWTQTGNHKLFNKALDYYYKYKREGGKRKHKTLEYQSYIVKKPSDLHRKKF